ncbi:MAG: hypothetical protein ABIP36_04950 [Acidimicrobiales bacterium]
MDETSWEGALRDPAGLVAGAPAGFAARLHGWLADAQVEGSAGARAQERWLRAAAEADATFVGMLVDLAERGTGVAISIRGGRRHHGRIDVIGADFVALHLASGKEVLLTLETVTAVRTAPRVDVTVGEQVLTTTFRLAEVLGELAAERSRVLLVPVDGADAVAGELRAVGHDVVTVRPDGDPPAMAYVPLGAIAEVALP